ncbi:ribosomal protein L1 [Lichtheimia hyalospora FSU 10163]|nr:ribosomal protein L1 [Lichtheimia hyalospora FSU 10163]
MIATNDPVNVIKSSPRAIPLKHSLQTPGTRRCLFTKDPQDTYKDLLISKNIKGVHQVIGFSKLKKRYGSRDKMAALFSEYDAFLTDRRITHLLPKVLGKEFYKKRKEPMMVDLTASELQKEILRALRSTYMHFIQGSYYGIKIASTALNESQAFDNLMTGLAEIIKGVPGGFDNIRSLQIKTAESISFTVYEKNSQADGDKEDEDEEDEWEEY